jgi:hypothetical protein
MSSLVDFPVGEQVSSASPEETFSSPLIAANPVLWSAPDGEDVFEGKLEVQSNLYK